MCPSCLALPCGPGTGLTHWSIKYPRPLSLVLLRASSHCLVWPTFSGQMLNG